VNESDRIKEVVRERYASAARQVGSGSGCCGPRGASCCDPITSNLYDATQAVGLPAPALEASLGCGNPTALAQLAPGETVLDLGSGGAPRKPMCVTPACCMPCWTFARCANWRRTRSPEHRGKDSKGRRRRR
jgi:hypothetical protein